MNTMEAFNRTMDYLDAALTEGVDGSEIQRLSGYSEAMFSRFFSVFTGMTLSEYLRFRRMTQAAFELKQSDEKVIDIAMKYGYDSPDSFGAAFKQFHGHTPSEVRGGKPFRVFSKLKLLLSIKGGMEMEVSIQKKPAFRVAGLIARNVESAQCPEVWDQLLKTAEWKQLASLGNGQSYGMCFEISQPGQINYMAGVDVTDTEKAKALGLDVVDVPEMEYAVAMLHGRIPDCIHAGWKYMMEIFLPEQELQHSGAPDFEVYHEDDMYSDSYTMELWVPIKKR